MNPMGPMRPGVTARPFRSIVVEGLPHSARPPELVKKPSGCEMPAAMGLPL